MRIQAALLAIGLMTQPAQAFTAMNGLSVNPVPGGFEVLTGGGAGPRDIWCAAAHYATRVQGAGATNRIYILHGYGPSQTARGYRSVAFTLQGSGGSRPGSNGNYSVSIRTPGFNLNAAHAGSFCADVFEPDPWPL